jgi:hypothetical protein
MTQNIILIIVIITLFVIKVIINVRNDSSTTRERHPGRK